MVFGLFSIFCNYPFRHLPLFVSTSAIIRSGISNYSFQHLQLSVPASPIIRFNICNYPFQHLQLFVSAVPKIQNPADRVVKDLSLTNIYKSGNRVNESLNVYFQADTSDAF